MKTQQIKFGITGLLLLIMLLNIGCLKVGEDDPAISLRSRAARLSGKWRVKRMYYGFYLHRPPSYGKLTITGENGNYDSYNLAAFFTDTILEEVTGKFDWELTFKRTGEFDHNLVVDGLAQTATGYWEFGDSRDELILKVVYRAPVQSNTSGNRFNSAFGNPYGNNQIYLKELRNNKIVMVSVNQNKDNAIYEYELESIE
jgi:hypothetical protein